jgi:dTDP-4-amino-4,6-dideoxygalactose transaminase
MTDWKVPLADVVVQEDDIAVVAETYRSGWLSMGPRTAGFEAALAQFTGARHALAVSNGTAGLHLLCAGVGLGPGDEAIVPSLTFVASANAIRYTGATAVFADIAGVTEPWLSAAAVEEAVTERTKAIMAVHYAGHPGEIVALRELADRRGLVLLEDAAHAAGSWLGGRHLGTFGAGGAFSFFSNKNLSVGEGGAVTVDDDDLAARMRLLRSHGMTTLTWDRHRGHASAYDVVELGYNYRIDEPRAALAERRLARLREENARRGALVERYRAALDGIDGVTPALPPAPRAEQAHHLFTVVLDDGIDVAAVRAALAERGVQTSVHYPPVHSFSIYAEGAPSLPVTEEYARRTLTLPLFAHMEPWQLELVLESVEAVLTEARGRYSDERAAAG